jgi:hypothetical protein
MPHLTRACSRPTPAARLLRHRLAPLDVVRGHNRVVRRYRRVLDDRWRIGMVSLLGELLFQRCASSELSNATITISSTGAVPSLEWGLLRAMIRAFAADSVGC